MNSIKTVNLTGTEVKAEFCGRNAWLRNDAATTIYAGKSAGIVAGTDGIISVPSGGSAPVFGAEGTVYLLGTGTVQIIGNDFSTNPFKSSAQSSGSGADDTARAAIDIHAQNSEIHITNTERDAWNTVNYINPNLLINPDFRINQRGAGSYSGNNAYSVDHWKCAHSAAMLTPTDKGLKLSLLPGAGSSSISIAQQDVEHFTDLSGETCTLSVCVSELNSISSRVLVAVKDTSGIYQYPAVIKLTSTGVTSVTFDVPEEITSFAIRLYGADMRTSGETTDSYTIFRWVKLEKCCTATKFLAPDPVLELLKCQRYYQIRSTNNIAPIDLRPEMRSIPSVTALDGGNYAYNAEL